MEKEASFGVIPLRLFQGKRQCFLVKLKSGNHWGFPKGHIEGNENPQETAFRELAEETNLHLVKLISETPFVDRYTLTRKGQKVDKIVTYFLAEVEGIFSLQKEEILDGGWFDLATAKDKITYPKGKKICQEVIEFFASKKS